MTREAPRSERMRHRLASCFTAMLIAGCGGSSGPDSLTEFVAAAQEAETTASRFAAADLCCRADVDCSTIQFASFCSGAVVPLSSRSLFYSNALAATDEQQRLMASARRLDTRPPHSCPPPPPWVAACVQLQCTLIPMQ